MYFFDDPKPKRKAFTKDQRLEVWKKWIGVTKAEGPCYVCKKTIHIGDFDVGHNVAKAKGGSDSPSNLRPICRQCNRAMGTRSIETYKKWLEGPAVKAKTAATKKPAAKRKPKDPWGFNF